MSIRLLSEQSFTFHFNLSATAGCYSIFTTIATCLASVSYHVVGFQYEKQFILCTVHSILYYVQACYNEAIKCTRLGTYPVHGQLMDLQCTHCQSV